MVKAKFSRYRALKFDKVSGRPTPSQFFQKLTHFGESLKKF